MPVFYVISKIVKHVQQMEQLAINVIRTIESVPIKLNA